MADVAVEHPVAVPESNAARTANSNESTTSAAPERPAENQQEETSAGAADTSSRPARAHGGSAGQSEEDASAFECNICLELAKEPVVTLCGHLFCWPCLFRWIQVQNYTHMCPVCKAGVEVDKVIPIYGRGFDTDPRQEAIKVQPVPPRPAGQRPAVVQLSHPMQAAPGMQGAPAAQQQGVLPGLLGFGLGPGQGYVEALTPEQQHQAFLSRLLLMLGSFVIMCLLLF